MNLHHLVRPVSALTNFFILRSLRRPWRELCRCVLIAALIGSFEVISQAASYSFTQIADSTGGFSDFGTAPSINASGIAAFLGTLSAGGTGIYTGSGGPLTTIALSSEPTFSSFGSGGTPINAAGKVAFLGNLDAGSNGIFIGDGVTTTTIVLGGVAPFVLFPLQIPLSINAADKVAFEANLNTGVQGVFAGSGGGSPTSLYLNSDPTFSGFGAVVSINTSGTVAFGAGLDAGDTGVFAGDGGATTSIAVSGGTFDNLINSQLSINAAGTVAFVTSFSGVGQGVGQGVFTGSGGATTTIVTNKSPFATFSSPSINTAGKVAFLANLNTGAKGIFTGPDLVADKIIRNGDALFGSVVNGLRFGNSAFNDAGQTAFYYQLTDGRRGIAVATPPVLRILSITRLSGETLHLEVSGVANLTYSIYATTNLNQSFTSIGTQTAATDGTFRFDDTNAPSFTQRFYRVTLP